MQNSPFLLILNPYLNKRRRRERKGKCSNTVVKGGLLFYCCKNEVHSPLGNKHRVQLFVTPWTVAHQAPPSMGFSRREYWSGLPFPSPGDFPDPEIKPRSPALEADALTSEPQGKPWK